MNPKLRFTRSNGEKVKMAYTDFSLDEIEQRFGVKNRTLRLFGQLPEIEPSAHLKDDLQLADELPTRSEKAKSESIVFPLLVELRRRNEKFFTIHSGDVLNADVSKGLNGECDFILAKDVQSFSINYPIMPIVEAKKNDLELGVPQCAAQLIGARIFNERKNVRLERLFGCVTTGNEWLFIKLEENEIVIDTRKYYLNEVGEIIAVFQQIIDFYRERLK